MSDHVAPTREVTDLYPPPFYDPLTTIAWLAAQSENLLFATSVLVVPYRHPSASAGQPQSSPLSAPTTPTGDRSPITTSR